jgi:hypothetical protein
MIEIIGVAGQDEVSPRAIEIDRQGNNVSVWVHTPQTDNGFWAIVSLEEFLRALVHEDISN